MKRKIKLIKNYEGGIDLLAETVKGWETKILTGCKEHSVEFWKNLKRACDTALNILARDE